MRSSAPEGPHAPRAKQTPPQGSSGATAGPAGASFSTSPGRSQAAPSPQQPATAAAAAGQRGTSQHQSSQRGSPVAAPSQQRSASAAVAAAVSPLRTQQKANPQPLSSPLTGSSSQRTPVQNSGSKSSGSSATKSSHSRSHNSQALPAKQIQVSSSPRVKAEPAVAQGIGSKLAQSGASKTAPSSSNNPPNFGEYDDQEWDVGVGTLLIDLEADIAQADRGRMSGAPPSASSATGSGNSNAAPLEDKASIPKLKIKRTKPTKTSEAKHEIVKTDHSSPPSSGAPTTPSQMERNALAIMPAKQHNGSVSGSAPCSSTPSQVPSKGEPEAATTPARTPTCSRSSHKKEKRRLDINGSSSPPPRTATAPPATPNSSSTQGSNARNAVNSHSKTPNGPAAIPSTIKTESRGTPAGAPATSTDSRKELNPHLNSQGVVALLPPHVIPKQLQQQQPAQQPNHSQQKSNCSQPSQQNTQQHSSQSLQTLPAPTNNLGCSSNPPAPQPNSQDRQSPPPAKKIKIEEEEEKKDACVGTSVGTITDPDCLGPCEPGSSVTLEGIVWHETEGGVLVVNVTWRGKTYVGTLLDCTKHDWAPPRFCDSPTSDLDARTPKGRAKRGRTAAAAANTATNTHAPELNVSETRSGKLRNTTVKNRRGGTSTPTYNSQSSPGKVDTAAGVKRKGKEAELSTNTDSKSAKRARSTSRGTPTNNRSSCSPTPDAQQPSPLQQSQENQDSQQTAPSQQAGSPGQPPQISTIIQAQETLPAVIQWVECPEPNCNKKFKHENGLSYHKIHAHSNVQSEGQTGSNQAKPEVDNEDNRCSPPPVTESPVDANSKDLVKPSVVRPSLNSPVSVPVSSVSSETSTNSHSPVNVQNSHVQVQISQSQPVFIYGASEIDVPSQPLPVSTNAGTTVSNTIIRHPSGSALNQQVVQLQPPLPNSSQTVPLVNSQNQEVHTQSQHNTPVQQQVQPPITQPPLIMENRNPMSILPRPQQPTQIQSHQQQLQSQSQPPHLIQQSPQQPQPPQMQNQPPMQDNNSVHSPILIPQQVQTQTRPTLPTQQQQSPSFHPQTSVGQQIQHPIRVELKSDIVTRVPQETPVRPSPTSLNGPLEPVALSTQNIANVQTGAIPQGTPLSSLPGNTLSPHKNKGLVMPDGERLIVKPKELTVNGISSKQDEEIPEREDTHSPAYSDISDANDSAPTIDGDDSKDDKKPEHLGGQPPYPYGLYFGGYNQPPHPYLMPSLQPSNLPLKPGDPKDKPMEKEKKDGLPPPGNNEFIKYPPQYLYNYPPIYPNNYSDPYIREPMYKELADKAKLESKECLTIDEVDRGPTDLSRSCHSSNPSDRGPLNLKEPKCDNLPPSLNKEPPFPDKRPPIDGLPYRYSSPFDSSRLPLASPHLDKVGEPKQVICPPKPPAAAHPSSISSPRVSSTPPTISNKDDKCEKRLDPKSEGVKPTMETTGPPPPPTSSYYSPFPYGHLPFDPYRPQIVPPMSLTAGFPPSYLPSHSPGIPGLRYPMGVPPPSGPEDLSRSSGGANILPPPGLYSASHKIAELQERAQKSPNCMPPSPLASKGTSLLTLGHKDAISIGGVPPPMSQHSLPPLSSPSPSSFPISSSSVPATCVSSLQHFPGERKTPPAAAAGRLLPHHNLPDCYPYSLLPTAQFPPTHFAAALGMNQSLLHAVGVVGASGPPPSAMGVATLPK